MLSRNIDIMLEKATTKGLQQGMQQGMQQGEFEVVKRLITKRFGQLNSLQENALKNSSADELLKISDRILDAKSIHELLNF